MIPADSPTLRGARAARPVQPSHVSNGCHRGAKMSVPYDLPTARVRTMVQLSDELVSARDRKAARRSTSRSDLIRRVLGEFAGSIALTGCRTRAC